jgi:septal ring factor EnvC (AmiA/AmiB activator)
MRIANPMYDVFFKFLMEDTDLAKELIGTIIDQEIIPDEMLEDDELMKFIVRLSKPLLSERLLREAEAEEAMEETLDKLESKIERIESKLEKQALALESKDKELESKDKELESKDKELERQAMELAELKNQLNNLQNKN